MPRWEADHKVVVFFITIVSCKLWDEHVITDLGIVVTVLQGAAVSTATCVQLHKRAEKIAAALTEKGSINTGENVVLLYPPSESCYCFLLCVFDFWAFFHSACVY